MLKFNYLCRLASLAMLTTLTLAAAAPAGNLLAQTPQTGGPMSVEVIFSLVTPGGEVNRFDLEGSLNTLASSIGVLKSTGNVELAGSMEATLLLEFDPETQAPVITSFTLGASSLTQTPLSLSYTLPTGTVQFSTSRLSTSLRSLANVPSITINQQEFATNLLRLEQSGGMASIAVPQRNAMQQNLFTQSVMGEYGILLPQNVPTGTLQLTSAGADNTYLAVIEVPLKGQMLPFKNVGLPVGLEFMNGSLRATATFTLPPTEIPEPCSLLICGIGVTGLALYRRFRTAG